MKLRSCSHQFSQEEPGWFCVLEAMLFFPHDSSDGSGSHAVVNFPGLGTMLFLPTVCQQRFKVLPRTGRFTVISLLGNRRDVSHLNIRAPNIRKKFFFEAVSAFLGLPSAGMLVLGIHECLLCCEVFNVEPHHSSIHVNSTQSFGGLI